MQEIELNGKNEWTAINIYKKDSVKFKKGILEYQRKTEKKENQGTFFKYLLLLFEKDMRKSRGLK